jgi:hypothetical protein
VLFWVDFDHCLNLSLGANMKAIIVKPVSNAYNYARDKELVGAYSVMGKINGEMREIVTARAYMGRSRTASTVYASIWVHAGELSASGKGSAGGYGYHKESAAFQDAIRSAGIELYGSPYGEPDRYNYDEKRPYTAKEMQAQKRKDNKKRCYIGGCGDSSMRLAFEAIARAAGAKGKLIYVQH